VSHQQIYSMSSPVSTKMGYCSGVYNQPLRPTQPPTLGGTKKIRTGQGTVAVLSMVTYSVLYPPMGSLAYGREASTMPTSCKDCGTLYLF